MANTNLSFDWQIDEFMVFCRSEQKREKTMNSYEQVLRRFRYPAIDGSCDGYSPNMSRINLAPLRMPQMKAPCSKIQSIEESQLFFNAKAVKYI